MIAFHRIRAYLLRFLYELTISIDQQTNLVLFPVMDLLTFGLLTVYIERISAQSGVAATILGGIIFWTLVYNIVHHITFSLLEDVWTRNIFNLVATPLRISEMIIGILLFSIMKSIVSIALLLLIAKSVFAFSLFQY